MSNNHKVIGLKEHLAYYRVHNKNISKDLDKEIIELDYCKVIFEKEKYHNLKKFDNFLNYRKFKNTLIKNDKLNAFKILLKLKFGFLKLKALTLFFFEVL